MTEAEALAMAQAIMGRIPDKYRLRPGTVYSADFLNGGEVSVRIDGDDDATAVQSIQPLRVTEGDRVMVMFYPPAGAIVLGVITPADVWHIVGKAGQPAFATGWGAFNGGWTVPRFRKEGDRVIVNGLAVTVTGYGQIAWVMPPGYIPKAHQGPYKLSASNGGTEAQSRMSVLNNGQVIEDDALGLLPGHRAVNFEYFLS